MGEGETRSEAKARRAEEEAAKTLKDSNDKEIQKASIEKATNRAANKKKNRIDTVSNKYDEATRDEFEGIIDEAFNKYFNDISKDKEFSEDSIKELFENILNGSTHLLEEDFVQEYVKSPKGFEGEEQVVVVDPSLKQQAAKKASDAFNKFKDGDFVPSEYVMTTRPKEVLLDSELEKALKVMNLKKDFKGSLKDPDLTNLRDILLDGLSTVFKGRGEKSFYEKCKGLMSDGYKSEMSKVKESRELLKLKAREVGEKIMDKKLATGPYVHTGKGANQGKPGGERSR